MAIFIFSLPPVTTEERFPTNPTRTEKKGKARRKKVSYPLNYITSVTC